MSVIGNYLFIFKINLKNFSSNFLLLKLSFYITLRGKVSIYINHNKHDDTDNLDNNFLDENSLNENFEINDVLNSNAKKSKRIREKLGNFVTSLGLI